MNKILFFNPRAAVNKYRVPNSILQVAASVEGIFEWSIVDGNRELDPYEKLASYLKTGQYKYIGFTVMPGPQTKQAIPFAKRIKEEFPGTVMIWGGYFPASHFKVILQSGYVDFVINGPGDQALPELIKALEGGATLEGGLALGGGSPFDTIKNLIYLRDGKVVKTPKNELIDQSALPPLPYDKLDSIYPMDKYLGKTFLGNKTLAYHSSIGCPFTCSFCAVVPIYEARWKAKTAEQTYRDVKYIKDKWGADAVEFHDNNFFVSEKRVVEFAKLMLSEQMNWWGMARIDTMDKWKDESLALIREAGCRIIFFGAESGNDEVLHQLDKGGTQSGKQIVQFAERLKRFDIIPEYSFVLGVPAPTPEKVMGQIEFDINFIKRVKAVNPATEIILYTYSPVPTEGSELYNQVKAAGFTYPEKLEDWITPQWERFDLRKNPLTPWLTSEMIDKIRDFETVLNGYFPTVSDIRLNPLKRRAIRMLASLRYRTSVYQYPYEIKLLHRLWRYRQPEIQGF